LFLSMSPVVTCDGAQPGRVEVGEVAGVSVPCQHTNRPFLRARVHLQVAEVVNARPAELPFDPAPGGVVVAEEGKRGLSVTNDRVDRIVPAGGVDGIKGRLMRQQHVKAAATKGRRAAVADPGTGWNPPLDPIANAPERSDAQTARQLGDVAIADAAYLA